MFLAEALVLYKTDEIRDTLQLVVNQLVINMEDTGGYGHDAGGVNVLNYREVEINSNWAVATMGMAQRLGIKVPKEKLAFAIEYIVKCQSPGGIGYSHVNKWGHIGRTGGALFAFAMCKQQDTPLYGTMCNIVNGRISNVINGHASPALSFYQSALGALQVGQETWDNYVQTWFQKIIEDQNPDGSFKSILNPKEGDLVEGSLGPAYMTSIYSLILLMDKGNLNYMSGARE